MPCELFNNGGCSCGGCCHFNRSLSITKAGTVLTISIGAQAIHNKEKVCIALAQNIPEGNLENTSVTIRVGTTLFPVHTKCGNNLYADQLRSRKVLHLFAATDLQNFVADTSNLCCTEHSFPTIPASAVVAMAMEETEVPQPPIKPSK